MIRVIPFHLSHLKLMDLDPDRPGILGEASDIMDSLWVRDNFICYTLLFDNTPIMCAGVLKIWNGVAEIFMYVGRHCWDSPVLLISIIKLIKNYLTMFIYQLRLHRIQGYVPSNSPECLRFAKLFGFKNEGTMHMFGPQKQDAIRVAYYGIR